MLEMKRFGGASELSSEVSRSDFLFREEIEGLTDVGDRRGS